MKERMKLCGVVMFERDAKSTNDLGTPGVRERRECVQGVEDMVFQRCFGL